MVAEDVHSSGLAAMIEQHRGELLRFLAARCGDPGEAEDRLQELWLKALREPAGPIANPRAYLFRMANNLVLDTARARRRAMMRERSWLAGGAVGEVPAEDRADPAVPADEALAEQQEIDLLHQAIAALPPGARQALCLFRIEEKPQAEIARIMGISRSGVEKHLALAMRHLRAALGNCGNASSAASSAHGAHGGEEPSSGQRP